MINTIIFDLGAVLIDWNPKYLYRKIVNKEEDINHFLETICTSDWNECQDAGRTLKEGTDLLIAQYPEKAALIKTYYDRWEEMLGNSIEGSVDILKKLKESNRYKLYALTNWSAETFPVALKRYDFLHWFDGIVVSGEEKKRKPATEFYQILLNRYNVAPQQSLFIDDNLRNIEGAKILGINCIHFTSPEQLDNDIRRYIGDLR